MVNDYRALLPLAARPVARFRVGVGRQTGLTEPYRHLTEAYTELTAAYAELNGAYAKLNDAYAQSSKAYEHTRAAYEHASGELGRLRAAYDQFAHDLKSLDVKTHPWRAGRAIQVVAEFREKMRPLGGIAPAAGDAPADERGAGGPARQRPVP